MVVMVIFIVASVLCGCSFGLSLQLYAIKLELQRIAEALEKRQGMLIRHTRGCYLRLFGPIFQSFGPEAKLFAAWNARKS
ncbi:MAG TPA: hypothetical protein VMC85_20825 [Desulfomonilaceae bacterium]|nr:hypothetical protein [Desulfomonilaceae bacterium]